jgi:predicted MFS family arabinose efflux permease
MDRLHVSGAAGTQLISYGFMANALALLFTQLVVLPRLNMGPRSFMIWGAAISCSAVVLQIFAPNLEVLLASQALLGLGAGLARPGFTGGASVAVEPHEQGAAAGLVVAVNGAEHFGMNAPLAITAAVLTFMSAFAIMSRRLRNIVTAPPPVDPPPS